MGVALAALLELTNSDAVAPQQQPPLDAQEEAAIKPAALEDQTTDPLVPPGFDCSLIDELGIDKQTNLRAGAIMIACGRAQGGAGSAVGTSLEAIKNLLAPLAYGGNDVNLITGTETYPNVTQSTTFAAGNPDNPNEILVGYNDSRGRNATPINISGASLSTDGGNSFVRLTAATGQSPFPNTYGDPVVLYNRPTATWYTVWLDAGCGGQGLGGYKSTTPSDPSPASWTHFCVHTGDADDRPSGWTDSNPASPFYGRMYVSWNDFNRGGGAIFVRRSTDNGATWKRAAGHHHLLPERPDDRRPRHGRRLHRRDGRDGWRPDEPGQPLLQVH